METKETALDDFLKAFRISLNFILMYSAEHKSFLKSLIDLKDKTEALFSFLDPIEIGFLAGSLVAGGTEYSKLILHKELAALFHLRKIQSLVIRRGVAPQELAVLLAAVARAPKEIIRAGGVAALLAAEGQVSHCSVQDLDYSQLLKGDGEEVKDICAFMLRKTVSSPDQRSIEEFIKDFELMADRIPLQGLLSDEELRRNLLVFLQYLAAHDRENLVRAASALLRSIITEGVHVLSGEQVAHLKELFGTLDSDELARIVWSRISGDERFDADSFELFSKLVEPATHERVAQEVATLARQQGPGLSVPAAKKIKELFFGNDPSQISVVYRKALAFVGADAAAPAAYRFDRDQLTYNYRFILLDLIMIEPSHKRLAAVLEKLLKEWDALAAEKNPEYWRALCEVVQKRSADCMAVVEFVQVRRQAFEFLEALAWEEQVPEGFRELLTQLDESVFDAEAYLKKIFEEGMVSPNMLALFFRFFGRDMGAFNERLQQKRADLELLSRIVSAVTATRSAYARAVLENIFAFSNDVIKIEVLQAMRTLGLAEPQFIFEVLRTAHSMVKREAFMLLSDQADIRKALEMLLLSPNPWGRNNQVLMENLELLVEVNCRQAREFLDPLGSATPFWNIPVKKKISEVRKKLYA